MNGKSILAGLAGGAAYWILGAVLYLGLLGSYFEANVGAGAREEVNMIFIVIGCLIYGLLLAVVYHRWAQIKTIKTGAEAGAIIGLLAHLAFNLIKYADSTFFASMTPMLVDSIVGTVMSAGGGAVVGWILGRGNT